MRVADRRADLLVRGLSPRDHDLRGEQFYRRDQSRVPEVRHGENLLAYDRDEAGRERDHETRGRTDGDGHRVFPGAVSERQDANEYALKVQPAAKGFGACLNRAVWLGKGKRPIVAVIEPAEIEPPPPEPDRRSRSSIRNQSPSRSTTASHRRTSEEIHRRKNQPHSERRKCTRTATRAACCGANRQ